MDISASPSKSPAGMCLGVEIPGEVHVIMKPVGGLIDIETLLHETGHAFFLSNFSPELSVEHRRLFRSAAVDETFAFLFMNLVENTSWLTSVAGMPLEEADQLAHLLRVKRLCLIRRYIGKFLAEKELQEFGNMRDATYYCTYLEQATGFVYEPQGYLIDMEPDFYALDYLMAWGGAHVLTRFLETQFGAAWFQERQAGDLLREMAFSGRRDPLESVLGRFCNMVPRLPDFSEH
jgi:hypothetical protein